MHYSTDPNGYAIQTSLPVCSRCLKDNTPADQQKFLSKSGYLICMRDGTRVPVPGKYPLPAQIGALYRNLLERHGFQTQRFEPNIADNIIDETCRGLSRLVLTNRRRPDILLTIEWRVSDQKNERAYEKLVSQTTDPTQAYCNAPILESIFEELTDPRKDRLAWSQASVSRSAASLRFRQHYSTDENQQYWLVVAAELFWDKTVPSEEND